MSDWTSKTGDARILHGSCLERLRDLPECSVQCCVTSPPYWGLRDYGHADQLGLESTPEAYVANMVAVFREVRRVLREDGVLWLNLGDSYASGGLGRNDADRDIGGRGGNKLGTGNPGRQGSVCIDSGLKPKDLVGIPWRVAFALQSDGWWLRQDIIWHKPNPMPESVTDRCTKAHEYIFLLTKSARYFYDSEAVKEAVAREWSQSNGGNLSPSGSHKANGQIRERGGSYPVCTGFRNRRSVWTVSTKPYSGAHFATYPPDLIEPCILAGTSKRGRCKACGAAWERVVERIGGETESTDRPKQTGGMSSPTSTLSLGGRGSDAWAEKGAKTSTIGWQPTCQCNAGEPIPCLVLDPFNGSGTTGEVCIKYGRHYIGCELNQDYIELAKQRLGKAEQRYGLPLLETA